MVVKTSSQSSGSAEDKLKVLYTQLDNLQKETEMLKQQVETHSQELKETSSSLVELNRKIERINNDIVELLKKIESLTNEISYLKRENIEIRQTVDTGKIFVSSVSQSVNTVSSENIISSSSGGIEFNDFSVINKKIEQIKKEVDEIKEQQKLQIMPEIKDPNLKRIVTSPYLVLTTLIISIFALIAAF